MVGGAVLRIELDNDSVENAGELAVEGRPELDRYASVKLVMEAAAMDIFLRFVQLGAEEVGVFHPRSGFLSLLPLRRFGREQHNPSTKPCSDGRDVRCVDSGLPRFLASRLARRVHDLREADGRAVSWSPTVILCAALTG